MVFVVFAWLGSPALNICCLDAEIGPLSLYYCCIACLSLLLRSVLYMLAIIAAVGTCSTYIQCMQYCLPLLLAVIAIAIDVAI